MTVTELTDTCHRFDVTELTVTELTCHRYGLSPIWFFTDLTVTPNLYLHAHAILCLQIFQCTYRVLLVSCDFHS